MRWVFKADSKDILVKDTRGLDFRRRWLGNLLFLNNRRSFSNDRSLSIGDLSCWSFNWSSLGICNGRSLGKDWSAVFLCNDSFFLLVLFLLSLSVTYQTIY